MNDHHRACIKCDEAHEATLNRLRDALKTFDEITPGRIKEATALQIRLPIILAGLRLRMYKGVCIGGCRGIDILPSNDAIQLALDLDNEVILDLDNLPKRMHTSNKEVF